MSQHNSLGLYLKGQGDKCVGGDTDTLGGRAMRVAAMSIQVPQGDRQGSPGAHGRW